MVDDELGGGQRVDLVGVAAEGRDGFTHRREVDDAGHAGEILHDDARWGELNLGVGLSCGIPRTERADLIGGDVRAVLGAQQVLEQHFEAERECLVAGNGVDPEHLIVGTLDRQKVDRLEAVDCRH